MIEVLSNLIGTRKDQILVDYCNEVLMELCKNEIFSFLNDVDLKATFVNEQQGTATRSRYLNEETVVININFVDHVRRIILRTFFSEFASVEQRCEKIASSLQSIAFQQIYHWKSFVPIIDHRQYFFSQHDQQSLYQSLSFFSSDLNTINSYMADHPEKLDECWKLFVIFLILHEVGHVAWTQGIKSNKFFGISHYILHKDLADWIDNPYRNVISDTSIDFSYSEIINKIGEEVFCDSIAIGGCFSRINKFLSVEEMRCAMKIYADVCLFLSVIDETVQIDLFSLKFGELITFSRTRVNLFVKLLGYLISENDLWPRYTSTSGGMTTHVYTIDEYFRGFWSSFALSTFLFEWRRNRNKSK